MSRQPEEHRCAQCNGEPDGREQYCAIGDPKSDAVINVWLHPECEAAFLAALDREPK